MESKKRVITGVIIGILILLLFLPFSPSAASSQLNFAVFLAVLGAVIIGLWILALVLAPISKNPLFKFGVGIFLCIFGGALAMHGSIHYRDISFLPLSAGITVLFISAFREIGRRWGQ